MSPFLRWCRFNLVGALGMALQLGALALLNRWSGGHYLLASAAAVELAVLHNFIWHVHYTWRDRSAPSSRRTQMLRFHLSNGMVSILGNLALLPLLVQQAHLPLLLADGLAILCCSLLNFLLSHKWAFALETHQTT